MEVLYIINPVAGEVIKFGVVLGINKPRVGLFTSSIAEFSGETLGKTLIETTPPWLDVPTVVDISMDSD